MRNPVRAVGAAVRRLFVPEWTAVLRDVAELRSDREHLLIDVGVLRSDLVDARRRADEQAAETAALRARVEALEADVDENRRLSARVAEVTDLVTEVVLPLHDREIDATRLRPPGTEPD